MTIRELYKDIENLQPHIRCIIGESKYEMYDDLSGVDIDSASEEDLFLLDETIDIMEKLYDIKCTINYLSKKIQHEGTLYKNSSGRYELCGREFTSGSIIEYLATDDRHMRETEDCVYVNTPYWKVGRIEHDGNDYYIVGASKDLVLQGLKVRVR